MKQPLGCEGQEGHQEAHSRWRQSLKGGQVRGAHGEVNVVVVVEVRRVEGGWGSRSSEDEMTIRDGGAS